MAEKELIIAPETEVLELMNRTHRTPKGRRSRKATVGRSPNQAALVEHSATVKGKALAAFRKSAIVMDACAAVGIGRRTWYDWIKADPLFAAQVLEAKEDAIEGLESSVAERAKSSDRLAMFMLKALRPAIYRDANRVTKISPEVTDRLKRTIQVIRDELEPAQAKALTEKLAEVWQ